MADHHYLAKNLLPTGWKQIILLLRDDYNINMHFIFFQLVTINESLESKINRYEDSCDELTKDIRHELSGMKSSHQELKAENDSLRAA